MTDTMGRMHSDAQFAAHHQSLLMLRWWDLSVWVIILWLVPQYQ
jgi:hypothetical protein